MFCPMEYYLVFCIKIVTEFLMPLVTVEYLTSQFWDYVESKYIEGVLHLVVVSSCNNIYHHNS